MERGKVKFFNTEKGFGFIESDAGDVFFHISKRSKKEVDTPSTGSAIFFDRQQGRRGQEATRWQLEQAAIVQSREVNQSIDPEQDRRDGYRPGVLIALRFGNEMLLGRRRGFWTWFDSAVNEQPHDAPDWMYQWGVPQGGIEEGETCQQAIQRELTEELGDYTSKHCPTGGWCDYIKGEPRFLFKDRNTFRVEKDGMVYKGKTLYAFLVNISSVPEDVYDWMYGSRQDEFWTLPCPAFEGGVQFYSPSVAIEMVQSTQKGPKGKQLVRLIEQAQTA